MNTTAAILARSGAAGQLLDWLTAQSEQRGRVEEITWDHPDMFRVDLALSERLTAIVFMVAARRPDDRYRVVGRLAVFDRLDPSPEFHYLAERGTRPTIVSDYPSAVTQMQAGFGRLFAALDKVPRD